MIVILDDLYYVVGVGSFFVVNIGYIVIIFYVIYYDFGVIVEEINL